jgi:RNA polymerase sigma-70 factor (ECF subfamily)
MNTNEQAFREALLTMLPRLRRYCYALTNNQHEADDLLQASVEKALARWQKFEPGSQFDRWMYRLCRNHWIDTMRTRNPAEELDEEHLSPDDQPSTEQQVATEQLLNLARQRMGQLSEGLRMVLYLVAIEGRSYQETADILDIPAGTVMSRLARARSQLSAQTPGEWEVAG